jgi:hypothetical protein
LVSAKHARPTSISHKRTKTKATLHLVLKCYKLAGIFNLMTKISKKHGIERSVLALQSWPGLGVSATEPLLLFRSRTKSARLAKKT